MGYVPTGGSGGASIGGSVSGATAGSVFFAGAAGVLAQNNTAFKWVDADTQLQLTAGGATKTPLLLTLAGSQSADAFQVKNSGGTTIASIDKDGYFCGGTSGGDTRLINTSIGTWSLILEAGNTRCSIYDGSNYLFRVDGDSTAGNTRMLVYDVDNGTLERVSVGAADSGGSGFKVLRIPN